MGLFDSRKPKWRHKDPAVRLASIEGIDADETELLAELAAQDPDREVRLAALNRLTDLPTILRLAAHASPEDQPEILARRETLLCSRIIKSQAPEEWSEDLDQITSPPLLADIAAAAHQPAVRLAAVHRIDDQSLLGAIVRQQCGKGPALAAIEKITDEAILADLSRNAAGKAARRQAADKIAEIENRRNPRSDRETVFQQLRSLAAEAALLLDSSDLDDAAHRLKEMKEEWRELDGDHSHPAFAGFNETCSEIEKRHCVLLERRKTGQEESARYARFLDRLEGICDTVERLSCSTDDDAETIKERFAAEWARMVDDARGEMSPSVPLAKRFTDACRAFDTNRQTIRLEAGQAKAIEKLYDETRELIARHDLKKAAARLAEAEKALASLEFKFYSKASFETLLQETDRELERIAADISNRNLSRRQEICIELENLAQSEKPSRIEKQLHALTESWQQLTALEDEEGKKLEQRFRTITATLNEKLKTLEHEKDWELWANQSLKEQLIERVVALDHEENLEAVVAEIKGSQMEWKKIGPVPQKESRKLWEAFQGACNRNFERAAPYLEQLKTRKAEAMVRRREICALAAELVESSDWQQTTHALKGLQEEWKSLPHGPRGEEHKLYRQFRAACDRFFGRRKEHYRIEDEDRQQNLLAKEKLCEEAERLAQEPKIDYSGKLKRLQAEWKKTGPAPRKKKDAVWKRFRAACDQYFSWLESEQLRNLQRKEEFCEAAERLVAGSAMEDDQKEIAGKLTELQQHWKETGPVPPERSDAVWKRFRRPIDQFFAARQEQHQKEEERRRENQDRKETLLARAEELAGRDNDRETAARLQDLQKEWFGIGPAPRDINNELDVRFKALCDAFLEGHRQFFVNLKAEQLENQKKKESLCLRLENILGLSYRSGRGKKDRALSLAEELKQAMEDNFMLAGRRAEKKNIGDEVHRIEQEWKTIGPVPPGQSRQLTDRYRKALDAYYKNRKQG